MDLNNLYDLAEKEHIKIYDYYIENAYGCFINIDKINAIALNLLFLSFAWWVIIFHTKSHFCKP